MARLFQKRREIVVNGLGNKLSISIKNQQG